MGNSQGKGLGIKINERGGAEDEQGLFYVGSHVAGFLKLDQRTKLVRSV
jgi:hypothetical protein